MEDETLKTYGPDPELYARLSEPCCDKKSALARVELFFDDLRELREEHGIADVVAIVAVSYKDGESTKSLCSQVSLGHQQLSHQLAAGLYRYHRAQVLRELDESAGLRPKAEE